MCIPSKIVLLCTDSLLALSFVTNCMNNGFLTKWEKQWARLHGLSMIQSRVQAFWVWISRDSNIDLGSHTIYGWTQSRLIGLNQECSQTSCCEVGEESIRDIVVISRLCFIHVGSKKHWGSWWNNEVVVVLIILRVEVWERQSQWWSFNYWPIAIGRWFQPKV